MKAIMRWGVGLLSLLLLTSVSHAYVWVSPVFKCPLPCAPDCFGPGFWMQGPHGMWYGPNYYLTPPCGPFNGMLPGPTGAALMQGGLPLTKDYKVAPPNATEPQSGQPGQAGQAPNAAMMQAAQPGQIPYAGMMQGAQPGYLPYAGTMQNPQPGQLPYGGTMQGPQLPGGYGTAPMYQAPYPQPMPYRQPMPQPNRPTAYMPYQGPTGMTYVPVRQDPATGIWLVQGAVPNQGGAFRPIPSFNAPMPMPTGPMPQGAQPYPSPMGPTPMPWPMPQGGGPTSAPSSMPGSPMMPGTPVTPGMPGMPMTPGMPGTPGLPGMPVPPGMASTLPYTTYGPSNGFQYYLQPGDPTNKMTPMQGPQAPRMDYQPMQLPQMEAVAPPPVRAGGPFPTHPFVRGPRDFFMWGETMDQERVRGSRPYPVP